MTPPVHVRIDTLRITAASALEARRLAEALPAAIERAWSREPTPADRSHADRVAERLVLLARAEEAARGWRA
ncbi:hypothetical protein PHK61_28795 [Actinomycetospora lutea]|uniref:hypothetical protein n=1 Tax=Actinomycetospora lutea TaxID=663604 RepID=UPI002366CBD3|nr:hypothetical protein [Actinomycetospora lutea]MDD7942420.1 hypothetical protein [Actinomycetospora lutea]